MAGSGGKTQKWRSRTAQISVRPALVSALALSLSACTALSTDPAKLPQGEDFVPWVPRSFSNQAFPVIESKNGKPAVDPKEQVKEADRLPRPTQTWWLEFGNEELGDLVETALANNYDLRVAVARIEQAERQAMVANSGRFPTIDFFGRREIEAPAGGVGTARSRADFRSQNTYQFGFRASYEVDLWGKIGYQAESALAQARASIFNRQAVALTLTSEVTTSYLQILSLSERIDISDKNLNIARTVAESISKRVEEGDSSILELQRQQITIALIQNAQASLKLQRERLINRLAVLLGKPPSAVKLSGKSLKDIKIPMVTPGLPSELLCRRPDIRRAEAQLAAASADVNAARANLLPSVTLTAEWGQGSLSLSDLLKPQSLLYNAAANLVQSVFDAERKENQLASARARNRELLDTYANTVLSALRDVEDALAGIRLTGVQRDALAEALERNSRLLDMSRKIFDRGAIDYVALLDTQRDMFQAEDAEASARFEQARASLDLFRALGGGMAPENDPCVKDTKANLVLDPRAAQKEPQDKPPESKSAESQPAESKPDEAAVRAKAEAEAEAKADAQAKARAEEDARQKAEQAAKAKAKAEAEAKAKADADAKARADQAAQQKAAADARAKAEAQTRASQQTAPVTEPVSDTLGGLSAQQESAPTLPVSAAPAAAASAAVSTTPDSRATIITTPASLENLRSESTSSFGNAAAAAPTMSEQVIPDIVVTPPTPNN